jgi:hypothetical protein
VATKQSIVLKAQAALDAATAFAAEPAPTPTPAAPITYLGSYPTPTLGDAVSGISPSRLVFGKHTAMASGPANGMLYLVGGDGKGHHLATQSGAMDTVGTYDVATHTYAEDFGYAGAPGEVTPRGLDFISFIWVPWLSKFWLGPGFAQNYGTDKYPWKDTSWNTTHFASYDPATRKFTDQGAKIGDGSILPLESFGGAADIRRKQIVIAHSQGLTFLDPANNAVTRRNIYEPGVTPAKLISSYPAAKAPQWYDEETDEFYFAQVSAGKVYAHNIGANITRLVASLLPAAIDSGTTRACVFITDAKHLLIVYTALDLGGDANSWKLINLLTGAVTSFNGYAPGCSYHNTGAYHQPSRTIVLTGGDSGSEITVGNNGQYFHEYRVDIPIPTPVPPPDPPPPPSPTDPAAWLPPVGEVKAISGPGTDAPNVAANVMYLSPAGPGSGSGGNYFGNWCSGVYAEDDGTLGSLVYCSGGDGDYWGNEVYKFLFDNRSWSRECERSTGLLGGTSGNPPDPNFDSVWSEHVSGTLRQPGVPHSYDQTEYLPAALGGGAKGSFVFLTRTQVYRYHGAKSPQLFDLDKGTWRRGYSDPNVVAWEGTLPPDAPSWCLDRTRNRYWGIKDGGIYITRLNWMSFGVNGQLNSVGGTPIPQFLVPKRYPTSRHWPKGDLLLVAGMNPSLTGFSLNACPLATPATGFKLLTLSGNNIPGGGGYGFVHCPDLDCFFVRTADGSRQVIWKITPPASDYLTGTWTVTQITMPGDTVSAKGNAQGMWKRFAYAANIKSLAWVDDINGPVYVFRVV